jgi:AcrR family transcriptional regulator
LANEQRIVKSGALEFAYCSRMGNTGLVPIDLPTTARSRARLEITAELLEIGRRHLAVSGAASLSLRAVAREAGMVSSAIYRYYPSRDDLLTALIVRGYESLAESVETAEAKVKRSDFLGRWRAAARAMRSWALANPHDYGLLYGTPVPGYQAPEATIAPVVRTSSVLIQILIDATSAERIDRTLVPVSRKLRAAIDPVARMFNAPPAATIANGIVAWSALFGAVSFELFGHLTNVIGDHEAFFEFEIDRLARQVIGLID